MLALLFLGHSGERKRGWRNPGLNWTVLLLCSALQWGRRMAMKFKGAALSTILTLGCAATASQG